MADWYVSSTAYAAVPQWAATTAYTVGQFVRALATPANPYQFYVHRCTTAGTTAASEPVWTQSVNGTTSSGTATFTNVTSNSTYGWSAAAGTLYTMTSTNVARASVGDRIFISSDHSETLVGSTTWRFFSTAFGVLQIISVNRAGSTPPVAADVTSGAAITQTAGNLTFDGGSSELWQGITFNYSGSTFSLNSASNKQRSFKNCAFVFSAGCAVSTANPFKAVFDNTTFQFATTGSYIGGGTYTFDIIWLNTASAIQGATKPTTLFNLPGGNALLITCRGVDLSAITGTLATNASSGSVKALFDSCKIASAVTRLAASGTGTSDELELVNCYDGTNFINERYTNAGALTTDRSTTLSGGAADDIGAFSFKMVSNANTDKFVLQLESFWFDVANTSIGSSKTATVELISSASLNNDELRLQLEYMGTPGTSLTSFVDSLPTPMTTVAALPASSATWNNPPGTPIKQYLRVTFTPQVAGRVRGRISLGKTSKTVWINPQIVLA